MSDNILLKIENATIFHHYKTILNDVCLNINNGDFIYVIGKTGSGKSSLLRTIYSDIPLKMGKIIFDNEDISKVSKKTYRFLEEKLELFFKTFNFFKIEMLMKTSNL